MKKLLLLTLLPTLLTGCIGRVIVYDPEQIKIESTKKTTSISSSNSTSTSSNVSKRYEDTNVKYGYTQFISKSNPKLDEQTVKTIAYYVDYYSKESQIDTKLVLALMARESSFRSDVVSPSGAIGLGQLLKSTAKDMGIDDPFDIEQNTKATVKYVKWLMKKNNNDIEKSLASYKIGHLNVSNMLKAGQDYPESTKNYINDIRKYQSSISET
ncbi:MAG: lytic transglycosylase domain-containing protein [Candidatus Sericytochromatia bacterium]